jgi:hypothetical protein
MSTRGNGMATSDGREERLIESASRLFHSAGAADILPLSDIRVQKETLETRTFLFATFICRHWGIVWSSCSWFRR